MTPRPGTILSGRYALTAHIAAGGMGEVWSASDTVLGRTVAVKILNLALSQQSGFLERFRAEARNAAALHHPNITTVFDYGEDDGCAYLVMELVAGQPLSQVICERAPLSAQVSASILIQAATALEAAHQGGVIHRDVKPANILITPDGTAKLTDFGISRLVNAEPLTQTGQILGTAQYLAPEQVCGQVATAASDVYALGVVGYEMLTGRRPFEAETMVATALGRLQRPAPQLPGNVPVGIRTAITAAMAKNPADRPASAAAMAKALGRPDPPHISDIPAAMRLDPPVLSLASVGLPEPTLAARTLAMTTPTKPMASTAKAGEPSLPHDRHRRLRPAWLWAAAAAFAAFAALAAFAAFDAPDRHGTPAPLATVTAPAAAAPITTSATRKATQSSGTTTDIATHADQRSLLGQRDMASSRATGHHNVKDGMP